jgi:hypothetical protein
MEITQPKSVKPRTRGRKLRGVVKRQQALKQKWKMTEGHTHTHTHKPSPALHYSFLFERRDANQK